MWVSQQNERLACSSKQFAMSFKRCRFTNIHLLVINISLLTIFADVIRKLSGFNVTWVCHMNVEKLVGFPYDGAYCPISQLYTVRGKHTFA